eukprot:GHVL01030222.1.p1 GENE.GHVL01030222.1~~GHVL01030222.1.p1  ORF type:complete len:272 (+),score=48.44 GHVL01030222.1:71-886(+)
MNMLKFIIFYINSVLISANYQSYDKISHLSEVSEFCPEGFQQFGSNNECTKLTSTRAKKFCPPDHHIEGDKCVNTNYVEAQHRCPLGFSMKKGSQCTSIETIRVSESCPDGYEREGRECVRSSTVQKDSTCSTGELVEGICVETNISIPEEVCPDGYKRRTELTGPLKVRDACIANIKEVVSSNLKCPKGYALLDNECVMKARPISTCPYGFAKQGLTECIKESIELSNANLICDVGYHLQGHECVQVVQHPPIRKCPTGKYKYIYIYINI